MKTTKWSWVVEAEWKTYGKFGVHEITVQRAPSLGGSVTQEFEIEIETVSLCVCVCVRKNVYPGTGIGAPSL